MDAPVAGLSIDVDSVRFYRAIHGEGPAPLEDEDPVYTIGMPRFFALAAEHGIAPTLFLVGSDAPHFAAVLAPGIAATGAEVASHSFAHDYHLSARDRSTIEHDLDRAERALASLGGGPVVGFRAPGYNVSPTLLSVLSARGYRYDSSLLPAPAYWGLRAAAIGAYRLLRRPSASLVGTVAQFAGPLGPYRTTPATPWRPSADGPLVELPMSVEPWSRLPFIGTTIALCPRPLLGPWAARVASRAFVNLELHAIDLVDATDHPALAALAPVQRELRVPVREKLERLGEVLRRVAGSHRFVPLREAASRLGEARGGPGRPGEAR